MGEALHTIRAEYATPEAAEKGRASLERLIAENAIEYWQNRRLSTRPFWQVFRKKFPVTTEVLDCLGTKDKGALAKDSGWHDGLVGLLCFEDYPEVLPGHNTHRVPEVTGAVLEYEFVNWYHARFAHVAAWLIKGGARRVEWETPYGRFELTTANADENQRIDPKPSDTEGIYRPA